MARSASLVRAACEEAAIQPIQDSFLPEDQLLKLGRTDPSQVPYFQGEDINSSLISPALWPETLKTFPPTLLINGTRDVQWGETVYTHNQLVHAGAYASLHLWEGGNHCFFYDPDLPESRDAYRVIVNFFDKHLGN